jgi:hypothetical protein
VQSPHGFDGERSPEGRRYLIAAGVSRYNRLRWSSDLPSVKDDLTRIVELFVGRFGYRRELPELGEDPTSAQLRDSLSCWFTSPDRQADDILVVYYSGHGSSVEGRHYLLASDSKEENLEGTALPADYLALMLPQSRIRQVLVLLDTCYAGHGVEDFSSVAGALIKRLVQGNRSRQMFGLSLLPVRGRRRFQTHFRRQ